MSPYAFHLRQERREMAWLRWMLGAICLAGFCLAAFCQPVIVGVRYHAWTAGERAGMTNCLQAGQCLVTSNYTCCAWATAGQVSVTFSNTTPTNSYFLQWQPWRAVTSEDFVLGGVSYSGSRAQGWQNISGPLTNAGHGPITFQSGVTEDAGFFRILAK